MKRVLSILTLLLLAGSLFAGGATEKTEGAATQMEAAGEAPQLAAMVKAGTLPPVEERLPAEPLVVSAVDSIGKYGGT